MIRDTFVMRNGKLVPKRLASAPAGKRIHVISDDLKSDLEHMAYADGRRTASKSKFRRWTKEAGCFEKGNDREPPRRPLATATVTSDVRQAIQMCREGYRPRLFNMEGE